MNIAMPKPQECNLNGTLINIRPISPEDTKLESEFVHQLSAETKHYRFLGGINDLSAKALQYLCDVDGEESMAFVATVNEQGKETEIGVSRYTKGDEKGLHEMAVTIADSWQDKGLDTLLTEHLLDYARLHGVTRLYAVELNDNYHMAHLAVELGMSKATDPEDIHQVIYSLVLS
ncbi:GNAT family N-acetyltransferase [Alteromonadaceae bacterium BrNp21-10]|nr:GNAT family N-acetyltransferase [Alteromonadaceae bacterium BrNp21-10]